MNPAFSAAENHDLSQGNIVHGKHIHFLSVGVFR